MMYMLKAIYSTFCNYALKIQYTLFYTNIAVILGGRESPKPRYNAI